MQSDEFSAALAKIRPHTNSKLPHQRKPAQLLAALEATLEQNAGSSENSRQSPTAYFAALITTLEECILRKELSLDEGSTLAATLYLLAMVVPFVQPTVLRANLSKLYQILPQLLPLAIPNHAPPLRSLISIFGSICSSMDQAMIQSTLNTTGNTPSATSVAIRQTLSSLLELTLDHRPKVRKRAAEVVKDILDSPPSPFIVHPWSHLVANWSCAVMAQSANSSVATGKKGTGEGIDRMIHLLAFLRTVPYIFSSSGSEMSPAGSEGHSTNVEMMTKYLLAAPKLSNAYLTQASYQLLTALFAKDEEEIEEEDEEDESEDEDDAARRRLKAQEVLDTLIRSQPSKTDAQVAPYWLGVVASSTVAALSSHSSSSQTPSALPKIWSILWSYLDSNCAAATVKAATDALNAIAQSNCFAISECCGLEGTDISSIQSIVQLAERSLVSLAYADSMEEMLSILEVLISSTATRITQDREWTSMTLRELHDTIKSSSPFLPLLQTAVTLRNTKDFQYKEHVNGLITAFMRMIGVDGVLQRIPLGILPQERSKSSNQANAYLLPLIPPSHLTPLSHFVTHFIPLSESLWNLAENSEKEVEQKVYRVLMEQVWAAFPSYCWGCWDIAQSFTPELAERLTQVLYQEPGLRAPILRALRLIVESNTSVLPPFDSGSKVPYPVPYSEDEARDNIAYLKKQAKSWLAVLFNVFTSVEKDSRNLVGEVISVWASIANEPELAGAYRTVIGHLNQNLGTTASPTAQQDPETQKTNKTIAQMLDILLILIPYLPFPQLREVISLCLEKGVLTHPDGTIQKLGYRILARSVVRAHGLAELSEDEKARIVEGILSKTGVDSDVATGAIKERLNFLAVLIPGTPPSSLHLVILHLMEAIMGVKEHSEKARKAAFELLVVMGQKMKQGGTIRMDLLGGSSESGGTTREASVEEFVNMVGASLAAEKDHTISAGVMSLSRVLFEFRADISESSMRDIISTVYPLLSAKNREIVKSVLGFVKLTIHSLPVEIVQDNLSSLVPALLTCLSVHGHHFKVKIRHIFERLLRKFGPDEIEKYTHDVSDENSGALKMIRNITKKKERAAKKKREAADNNASGSEEERPRKTTTGDAFEDVIYGSESELEESDDDGGAQERSTKNQAPRGKDKTQKSGRRDLGGATRLRVDDDEPMDLLEGAAGMLMGSNTTRRRQPGKEASKFKLDEDTGKMIIGESDSDSEVHKLAVRKHHKPSESDTLAGAAYKETLVSVDGFTRNPNGSIKFHKDTKKRRREEMEAIDNDVEMEDANHKGEDKRKQKQKPVRLGQEFKAKKAGGDVKKNGMDPYAYLPLSQAANRQKGRNKAKVSILGK